MSYEWLLFGHLAGAFLFVGGAITATVLRIAAMRRQRPGEIAVLLRATRLAIPPIAIGLLLAIGFGFWLTSRLDISLGSTWLTATFVLVGWILVVGELTGRQDRHTRELAEHAAAEGDERNDDVHRRLRDPVNLGLTASLLVATIAVVALMIWKP
jgi:uncharacterized membrane protein